MRYVVLIIFLMSFHVLSAQTDDIVIPSEIKFRSIVNEPLTLRKGFLRVGTSTSFVYIGEQFNSSGEKVSRGNNTQEKGLATDLLIQYGVADHLQIELFAPFYFQESNGSYISSNPSFEEWEKVAISRPAKGLGDISIAVNYQLIKEDASGSGLVAAAIFTLPTGNKDRSDFDQLSFMEATGNGEFQVMGELKYRKVLFPYSFDGFVRYRYSFGGSKIVDPSLEPIDFQSGGLLSFSANFSLMLNDFIAFKNGLSYTINQIDTYNGQDLEFSDATQLSYFPFISFQFKKFRVEEAVLFPLAGKNISADKSFYLILRYIF